MLSRPLSASFQNVLQASILLVLLCFLPFIGILGAWYFWGPFFFLIATFALGLWVLPGAALSWKMSWPPLALGVWVLFEVLRAPEWDRSFGLLMVWSCAVVLGLVAHGVSRQIPSFPWAFCLLLWGLSTVISVMNPIWTVPVEFMEESIQDLMYNEDYKQAILHAASQSRFHFPFGNPIDLGVFLSLSLLSFPVLLDRAWGSLSARVFVMGVLVSAGVQAYILLGTRSRTSLVGLLAGVCVWLLWKGKGGAKVVWIGILVFGLGLAVLCLSPTGREMLTRTETVHARLIFWDAGVRMARENPVLGLGIGGYGSHYPRFRELTPHQTIYAHNLLIEAMADMGAIGLGLLLTVLLPFAWRMYSLLRSADRLTTWCISALVSFFVSTLLGFHQNMFYLIGYVGVILGMTGLKSSEFIRCAGGGSRRMNSPLRQCGMVVVLMAVGIPCAFREAGKSCFEKATMLFETRRDVLETRRLLEKAVAVWPPLAEAHSYLGGLMMDTGDWTAAESSMRASIRWNPTAGFLHDDLAQLLERMGRKEEALQEVEKAISLHPVKYTYYLHQSRLLYDLGRTAEAAKAKVLGEFLEQYEPRYEEARKAQAQRDKG